MKENSSFKLPREFYKRQVLAVARDLLGKYLVKGEMKGKIVEVEAYDGSKDQAAHTYIGRTRRNSIMFGEGGYFYVYFSYGAHYCCNVVTGNEGEGTAVLIRAVEPVEGIRQMIKNRYNKIRLDNQRDLFNLTSGPGKVCRAFGITKEDYGSDLTGNAVWILNNEPVPDELVGVSPRIGIRKSADLPWRFFIINNPFLSRK